MKQISLVCNLKFKIMLVFKSFKFWAAGWLSWGKALAAKPDAFILCDLQGGSRDSAGTSFPLTSINVR